MNTEHTAGRNRTCWWRKPKFIALFSALIGGVTVNLFGLTNVLQHYDNIYIQPGGVGENIRSGRWMLAFLGKLVKNTVTDYNLHYEYGLIFILLIAVSAFLIADLYHIRSVWGAAFCGLSFVTFPSFVATMFFRYTVPYYGLAILLSVLAAYIPVKGEKHCLLAAAGSILCTACSLGIYQAYFPFTAALLVLYLIQQSLVSSKHWYQHIYAGLYYLVCMAAGLLLYFGLMKMSLRYCDTQLLSYKGIDSIGHFEAGKIPYLIFAAFRNFWVMPVRNMYRLAPLKIIMAGYYVLGAVSVIAVIVKLIHQKPRICHILTTLLLCLIFPVAVNLITLMCSFKYIYSLMVYPFVLTLIAPTVLYEALPDSGDWMLKIKKGMRVVLMTVLTVMTLCYAHTANVNYTAAHYATHQTENYFTSMVTQIRMTDGFTSDKKWAFLGTLDDPLFCNAWQDVPLYQGIESSKVLVSAYSWPHWIYDLVGYQVPFADDQTKAALSEKEAVKQMPCWPDEGSVQVVDDCVVIKFSE